MKPLRAGLMLDFDGWVLFLFDHTAPPEGEEGDLGEIRFGTMEIPTVADREAALRVQGFTAGPLNAESWTWREYSTTSVSLTGWADLDVLAEQPAVAS